MNASQTLTQEPAPLPVTDQPVLLDYRQTARLLNVKLPTLYSLKCRGQLPFVRVSGRLIRFDLAELRRWLDARSVSHRRLTEGDGARHD
jgi:excisionase family DNA binding protein